jgi:hypothetical protein
VDIEAAVAHLEEINRASPAETWAARKDRDKTGESLAKMLEGTRYGRVHYRVRVFVQPTGLHMY